MSIGCTIMLVDELLCKTAMLSCRSIIISCQQSSYLVHWLCCFVKWYVIVSKSHTVFSIAIWLCYLQCYYVHWSRDHAAAVTKMAELARLLEMIDLKELLERFQVENITVKIISSMSDADMIRVGVSTIGDRIRLRECAKQVAWWNVLSYMYLWHCHWRYIYMRRI